MRKLESNYRLAAAVFAVLLAWGASTNAQASTVSANPHQTLQGRSANHLVPVIISFADRVNPALYVGKDRLERSAELIRALRDKSARTQAPAMALLQARGVQQARQIWATNSIATKVPASVLKELEALSGIESIRLDSVVSAPVTSPGSGSMTEWNIAAIHAPEVWDQGFDGSGVVVANMDTGVDASHPDLVSRWRGGSNSWYDPSGEHATPSDMLGHGTQTMGIMVGGSASGTAVGVAPGAQWIAVKIFNDAGQATLSGIHLGFQWLLDPDGDPATPDAPDVVNNSWGLQNSGGCSLEFNTDVQVLKAAGISVVFAGGNSGPAPLSSASPANNPESFAVGAVDSGFNVAGFSSQGPSACDGTFFPELTAPGVDIKTVDLSFGGLPNYVTVSGSSYSAPHVAGAFALLSQAFPAAGVAVLEAAMKDKAHDFGLDGPDSSYGYGVADVLAAYTAIAESPPDPTPNRAPVANGDSYSMQAGATLGIAAPGLLGNDSDPDGNPLNAVLVTPPAGGALTLNANGSFNYTPTAGTTADTFTYQVSDGVLSSNIATVSIDVISNQAPTVVNDSYSVQSGGTLNVSAPGVLGNDSDPEGTPLTAVLVGNAPGGTLTFNADGSFIYKPRLGTMTDSFIYRASDGLQSSSLAAVSIVVTAPNKVPVARNDSASTKMNTALAINVAANDSDADGSVDPASISIVTQPSRGGSVSVNSDGTVNYMPKLNFIGIESFAYNIKDNLGAVSNKASVTVVVRR